MSVTGTAAIRRLAKEETEKPIPRLQKVHQKSTPVSSLSNASLHGRSHSADVPFHRLRRLPPLATNSSDNLKMNSSLPRSVQSAPTAINPLILSPLRAPLSHNPPRENQKNKLTRSSSKLRSSTSVDSNVVIRESDENDPD